MQAALELLRKVRSFTIVIDLNSANLPAAAELPAPAEIIAAIPPQGIFVKDLLARFSGRYNGKDPSVFIKLVRSIAKYDKETKLIHVKEKKPVKTPKEGKTPAAS